MFVTLRPGLFPKFGRKKVERKKEKIMCFEDIPNVCAFTCLFQGLFSTL